MRFSRRSSTQLCTLLILVAGVLCGTRLAGGAEGQPGKIGAVADKVSEAALRELQRVSRSGTLAERETALEVLIALGDVQVLGPLGEELGKTAVELRRARAAAFQLRYEIARKQELISDLERRLELDGTLEDSLKRQRERLEELQGKYGVKRDRAADLGPWYDLLQTRSAAFAATAPSGVRKKVEKELWKTVDQEQDNNLRSAAIEVLGCLGNAGTAVRLQKEISAFAKQQASARSKLPKLMREVVALERRMQEETERTGGKTSLGQQYARAKVDAAALQRLISGLGLLCDTAVVAGGRALAREPRELREKALSSLLRAQKKSKHGARRLSLLMIGACQLPETDEALYAMLVGAEDPLTQATLIDVLTVSAAGWTDSESRQRFEELLQGTLILDESWFVRSQAVRALSQLRSKQAIPILIRRLGEEEGRMLDDLSASLISLTGQDFHGNRPLWKRWWEQNGESFVVPPIDEIRQALEDQKQERRGSTFFGISTESTRVLYVIDLSGSMNFSMIPRDNPDDNPGRPFDMPRKGEHSRLEEAKLALSKAIAGTARDGSFNIILYASDVWSWSDSLEKLTDENRAEALDMVSRLTATGATNIYGALKVALEMAGADPGDRWADPAIDTIYFLSDGRASVGLTTDPEEILRFVRELNATAGIVIHTVGLSGAQDAFLMRSLAEQNGGVYVSR